MEKKKPDTGVKMIGMIQIPVIQQYFKHCVILY